MLRIGGGIGLARLDFKSMPVPPGITGTGSR